MAARNLPEALKLIMEHHGWLQNDLARELGVSQTWVSQASRGERDPGIARTSAYLTRIGWEVRITPKMDSGGSLERREFMTAVASIAFVPAPRCGPYEDAEYVHAMAKRLDLMRDEQGGVPLVSTALRHLRHITHAVNSRDRKLQVATSELARKASLILFDAKIQKSAEQATRLALALARKAGYTEGAAHVFENLCSFSQHADANRAAVYAQRGLRLPDLSEEHRARLNVRLSTSLARSKAHGAQRITRNALDDALGATEISNTTKAVIMGNAGIALARLGRYEDANTTLATAVRMFSHTPHMYSLYLAQQIKSALASTEPVLAAELIHTLTRVAPLIASARLERHVLDIMSASRRWQDVPEMRSAIDHLREIALSGPTPAA